jgi:2-polyprenyl-3-methyl-5-hydroxy-6-metoxy-1,4-benzoquinol methylase
MSQNIYDDQGFFDAYRKLRENKDSANNVEERPALFALLPDLQGKRILDLGCGYGENCRLFSESGAESIMGIDISEKMLAVAQAENRRNSIKYVKMRLEDLDGLNEQFDVVVSSLALHYVEDFESVARNVYGLLDAGGYFIFSQEHPLITAPKAGVKWESSENGSRQHYCLTDYTISGKRVIFWLVDGVIKYHRNISDIINPLIAAGFKIEKLLEPIISQDLVQRIPSYKNNAHVPNYLMVKAKKCM